MRKNILMLSCLLWSVIAGAQAAKTSKSAPVAAASDKYVVPALTYLKDNNPEQARMEIDKAFTESEAKPGAKTLLAKAQIYFALNAMDKYKEDHLYRDAIKALLKLVDQKPDFEKSTVDQLLLTGAYMYYNDGAQAYNDKKLTQAPELLRNVVKIHDLGAGKRFEKFSIAKQFDTVAADAYQILASAAFNTGKYEDALPLLIIVKNNPITRTPSSFENLIYAYNIQKNSTKAYEVIQEGRKAYPDDLNIRNYELQYFADYGKKEDLIKKLDAALAKDPQDSELYFDKALLYMGLANPAEGKKPENAGELHNKAEESFLKAIAIAPNNSRYLYTFGSFYYNRAGDINDNISNIKGTTDADVKKHNELKDKSDALLVKAQPYFERAYSIFSANASSLREEEKKEYHACMQALYDIYDVQHMKDKAADMKSKYDAYHSSL